MTYFLLANAYNFSLVYECRDLLAFPSFEENFQNPDLWIDQTIENSPNGLLIQKKTYKSIPWIGNYNSYHIKYMYVRMKKSQMWRSSSAYNVWQPLQRGQRYICSFCTVFLTPTVKFSIKIRKFYHSYIIVLISYHSQLVKLRIIYFIIYIKKMLY